MATRKGPEEVLLAEALTLFAEPDELTEFAALRDAGHGHPLVWTSQDPPRPYETAELRFRKLKNMFLTRVRDRLNEGALRATGRDTRLPVNSPRIVIPADVWPLLEVQVEESTATLDGAIIRDIRITLPTPTKKATIDVERRLEQWFRERIAESLEGATKASLWAEAQLAVPEASLRAFNRIWKQLAPTSLQIPGRRKS